jgi:phosphinothricin acetyltransferase
MIDAIRLATLEDAKPIADIYSYYITNTSFTFDTEPPSVVSMRKKMIETSIVAPWYVAEKTDKLLGMLTQGNIA